MRKIMKTIKDMDKILLIVSIILFVFGLFNIVTASSQVSVLRYNQPLYNYFYKQLFILILGFILTILILIPPTILYYHKNCLQFLYLFFHNLLNYNIHVDMFLYILKQKQYAHQNIL